MRTYDRKKNTIKKRGWRERHRKEYNEYQKLYKRKLRGSRLVTEDESVESKKEKGKK